MWVVKTDLPCFLKAKFELVLVIWQAPHVAYMAISLAGISFEWLDGYCFSLNENAQAAHDYLQTPSW